MKKQLLALTALAASLAVPAFACNPWISPTDTSCQGMVMAISNSANVWTPQYNSVTPTTGVVTGTIAFNTAGVALIVTNTTNLQTTGWVKLGNQGAAGSFVPATAQ